MKIGYTKDNYTVYQTKKGLRYINQMIAGKRKRKYLKDKEVIFAEKNSKQKTKIKKKKNNLETQIKKQKNNYDLEKILKHLYYPPIGSGTYGEVYRIDLPNLKDKVLKVSLFKTEKDKKTFENELSILSYLTENNVKAAVKLYAYGIKGKKGYFVLDALDSSPSSKRSFKVPEKEFIDALKEIHKYHVLHDDIKMDNIMYLKTKPIFIDFGKSKILMNNNKSLFANELNKLKRIIKKR